MLDKSHHSDVNFSCSKIVKIIELFLGGFEILQFFVKN